MTGAVLDASPTSVYSKTVFDVSIIIVSFNTCAVLRECLRSVVAEAATLRAEIVIVDNGSTDGSAEMVELEFPKAILLSQARGNYCVLLNSDAIFAPGALTLSLRHMEEDPECALGGGRLVGRDGSWQPSSRCFHSILNDAIVLTGLAARYPKSRLFGRFDRTWADENKASEVDWVPAAFSIIRPDALRKIGLFDPDFFLYYEEVDLCLRMKRARLKIWYWPDIVITHLGGESSRQHTAEEFSEDSSQVVLWRMRSMLLYYRKHHGFMVHGARLLEQVLCLASILRNRYSSDPWRQRRERNSRTMLQLMQQAWNETCGGKVSPPRPW
jgi:GT2 family glycosyltransferase